MATEADMDGGRTLPMVTFNSDGVGTDYASMEGGDKGARVKSGVNGFVQYMFNFDQKTKGDLLNLAQYGILGVPPTILMLKLIKNYFPSADEHKGTPELAIECAVEILFILFSIYFIHRLICYVPTYSGVKYEAMNVTQSVLLFLVILFTIQTKLGTKLNIVIRRMGRMVEGYTSYGGEADDAEHSVDAGSMMLSSLERDMIGEPTITPGNGNGGGNIPVPSLVPTSQGPGLHSARGRGGPPQPPPATQSNPGYAAGPAASDGFSSGSLSGAAW